MLQPKRTKFRKAFKGRIHGDAKGGTELNFGAYGLKAHGARADHRAPDRGGSPRDHASHQAPGALVDPHLPGRAGVVEAGRSPHGLGQGLRPNSGSPASSRAASCSSSTAFPARSPRPRSSARPRSCRSRPRSSPASATSLARGGHEHGQDRRSQAAKTDDQLQRAAGRAEARAVQPALPVRDQPAREAGAGPRSAPHHRPDQDAADRARPRRAAKA